MGDKKRLRKEETETTTMVDRLSHLPESLQLGILSSLDVREAVRTSMLSKSWVSSWTCIPILNFNSDGFESFDVFDEFVDNVLSCRQPVKLDKLTFKRRGISLAWMLDKVVGYAISHGVEELEVNVLPVMDDYHWRESWSWPWSSSDSLTSLKLQSAFFAVCPFLEPTSVVSFKNLTNLHFVRVIIRDPDPFSRFPALDKLALISCDVDTHGAVFNIRAAQLSRFTCVYYHREVNHWELMTPKLRYFEWGGYSLPPLKAHLPVLDIAVINYQGRHYCKNEEEKIRFENLLILFNTLSGAKSLTISAPTVHLLTLFPVINGCSPFHVLKCLKLDFTSRHLSTERQLLLGEMLKLVPRVKAYLLQKSHDAKCTIINDPNLESLYSSSQNKMCDTAQRKGAQQAGSIALGRPRRMVKKPARFLD